MEEPEKQREYKYKLKAEDFVKLFLANDEQFGILKSKFLNEGNEGVNGIWRKESYTFLDNVNIIGHVNINNEVKEDCTLLYCANTRFSDFIISETILSSVEFPILNFKNCVIRGLKIEFSVVKGVIFDNKCVIKTLDFFQCYGHLLRVKSSNVDSFMLNGSVFDSTDIEESIITKVQSNLNISRIFKIHSNCRIEAFFSSLGLLAIEFIISDSQIKSFSASKLFSSISIRNSAISLLNLNDSEINKFSISLSCKMEVNISGGFINEIYFGKVGINRETLISFSKVQVYAILMDEFSMLGNLYFRNIIMGKEPFEWRENFMDDIATPINDDNTVTEKFFQQTEEILQTMKKKYLSNYENLKKRKVSPMIQISQSSLGKTEFTDCPLNEFRFEFSNSKITDCFISGGSIPTKNVHIIGAEPNSIKEHEQKASFFNQFKKIFEAQGDIYHATQFQAKWAEEQRKYLRLKRKEEIADIGLSLKHNVLSKRLMSIFRSIYKPIQALIHRVAESKLWKRLKIIFNPTSNDLLTLWLNRISNLHGESWVRTLGVFFCLIIPTIYILYLWSLNRIFINKSFDASLFWKYFEFLNPAHSTKFIDGQTEVKNIAILIDFIGRIVVSYAIYQFIAAFRKHTKKQ